MKKVFLGGTCNGSTWREHLIKKLKIDYFNPVVEDWNEAAQEREIRERKECDFCLYVITPQMTGVYSIAEVVDDSNKRPEKTVFMIELVDDDCTFNDGQLKSLYQVGKMVAANGAGWFSDFDSLANYLNESGQ